MWLRRAPIIGTGLLASFDEICVEREQRQLEDLSLENNGIVISVDRAMEMTYHHPEKGYISKLVSFVPPSNIAVCTWEPDLRKAC